MMTDDQKIDKLVNFQQRNKFSIQAWNERGLNPSSDELCQQLTLFFNSSSDTLISGIKSKKSVQQLKGMLKSELSRLNKLDYDTEEKEFICGLFNELAPQSNEDRLSWGLGQPEQDRCALNKLLSDRKSVAIILFSSYFR